MELFESHAPLYFHFNIVMLTRYRLGKDEAKRKGLIHGISICLKTLRHPVLLFSDMNQLCHTYVHGNGLIILLRACVVGPPHAASALRSMRSRASSLVSRAPRAIAGAAPLHHFGSRRRAAVRVRADWNCKHTLMDCIWLSSRMHDLRRLPCL